MECDGGWQVAGRRRGAARRGHHPSNPALQQGSNPTLQQGSDCRLDTQRITHAMNELRGETFWMGWRDVLRERLLSGAGESPQECVCYGLGNFTSCVSGRYQLSMLLLLLETLQIPVSRCCVYDPVFSEPECVALTELGFTVLTDNEEGKRPVYQPTLFYLMHCGKALYNNLLWRNWTPQTLQNIIIIGNSFHGIQERMLQREFERDYSFLSHVVSVCAETSLPCSLRFLDVFNDTALIQFPPENLEKLPETVWIEPSEPLYQHCHDLEIIRRETS